ncbi:MAG: type I phosphomannose isomerase catalytic subunit [Leptospiraceae bacterium]|nr:type I phosphomannose isomerase catalytic subunit [Leptospiraceae bacterium]
MEKILRFQPIYKEKIWGGRRLESEFGRKIPSGNIGESWEISDYGKEISIVSSGKWKGKTLRELYKSYPKEIFGENFTHLEEFPLLVKLLDAKEKLSVQVHPDNEYALKFDPSSKGKKEAWLILSSDDNSEIVCGFANDLSKDEYKKKIESNQAENDLKQWKTTKGDSFIINPGTIHAIGGGNLILEVQQSSDSTYRVYDYGRLGDDGKPRELHIQKSLDVLNFKKSKGEEKLSKKTIKEADKSKRFLLESNDKFRFEILEFNGLIELPCLLSKPSFQILTIIAGQIELEGEILGFGDTVLATAYGVRMGISMKSIGNVELAIFTLSEEMSLK